MNSSETKSFCIALLSSEFPPGPGGIGQHAYSLAYTLSKRNINVKVLTQADYANDEEIRSFDSKQHFNIDRFIRFGPLTLPLRILKIIFFFCFNSYSHVIISGKFPVWVIRLIKLVSRKSKILVFLHGSEINLPNRWQKHFFQWNLMKADILYPVSNFSKSILPERIIQNSTIEVFPNGIILDELQAWERQEKYHLKGSPSVLTVGRVSPRKGQHNFVRALPELIKQFPNIHYHVVGIPNEDIVRLANELNVLEYITIHGHVKSRKDLGGFYMGADCFAFLSEKQPNGDVEGFGIAILEANFFGLPCVASNDSGVTDAVQDGFSGILVDPHNVSGIVSGLRKIMDAHDQFRANARQWVKGFDWDQLILKLPFNNEFQ
jgi:phosphatidylinositol alpha-1,6-mannosyltransferase